MLSGLTNYRSESVKPTYKSRVIRKNTQHTTNGPRFKSTVWACFSGERLGPIVVIPEGGVDGEEYLNIIYEGLLGLFDDLGPPQEGLDDTPEPLSDCLFMQDNAPCRRDPEVLKLLDENGVPKMEWPPNSRGPKFH
jgi:hypothetical protein